MWLRYSYMTYKGNDSDFSNYNEYTFNILQFYITQNFNSALYSKYHHMSIE